MSYVLSGFPVLAPVPALVAVPVPAPVSVPVALAAVPLADALIWLAWTTEVAAPGIAELVQKCALKQACSQAAYCVVAAGLPSPWGHLAAQAVVSSAMLSLGQGTL